MEVTRLGWVGTRTSRSAELADFYATVLQLPCVHRSAGFWVFRLPDGHHVEVFDEAIADKAHFSTGPVVGFEVTDLAAATAELRAAGVELLGEPGPAWQHFRGPDGNVYELTARPSGQDGEPAPSTGPVDLTRRPDPSA